MGNCPCFAAFEKGPPKKDQAPLTLSGQPKTSTDPVEPAPASDKLQSDHSDPNRSASGKTRNRTETQWETGTWGTPARETLQYDETYASQIGKVLRQPRQPLMEVIQKLREAGKLTNDEEFGTHFDETKRTWHADRMLDKRNLKPDADLMDAMLVLFLNTSEEFPFYTVWREATKFSSVRMIQHKPEFDKALRWMAWVEHGLSLIPPMAPTRAFRIVKGWIYMDFEERFKVGRTDLVWYEPRSVTVRETLAREWAEDEESNEQGKACTLFIIVNCMGHDVSYLSEYPEENEAMTRALTPFEVLAAERRDPTSADALKRCDQVTLKQLPKLEPPRAPPNEMEGEGKGGGKGLA